MKKSSEKKKKNNKNATKIKQHQKIQKKRM
jgi:hypothetical protein